MADAAVSNEHDISRPDVGSATSRYAMVKSSMVDSRRDDSAVTSARKPRRMGAAIAPLPAPATYNGTTRTECTRRECGSNVSAGRPQVGDKEQHYKAHDWL